MRRVLPLIVLMLFACGPAAADEVRLANGDRLTGRVLALVDGTLSLTTPHGDLRIAWPDVAGLTVDGPMLATTVDLDYDRSPAPGRRTTDRTFALTLGYRF